MRFAPLTHVRFQVAALRKFLSNIDVYFSDDTVWMTQKTIAELYQTTPQNVTLHIKNIYQDGELEESSTCKKYLQVQILKVELTKTSVF